MSVAGSLDQVDKFKTTLRRGNHFGAFSDGNGVLMSVRNIFPCPVLGLNIPITVTISLKSSHIPIQMTLRQTSQTNGLTYPHCNSVISTWWNVNALKFYFASHYPRYRCKVVRKVSLRAYDKLIQEFVKACYCRKTLWSPDIDNLHSKRSVQVRLCSVSLLLDDGKIKRSLC